MLFTTKLKQLRSEGRRRHTPDAADWYLLSSSYEYCTLQKLFPLLKSCVRRVFLHTAFPLGTASCVPLLILWSGLGPVWLAIGRSGLGHVKLGQAVPAA